MTPWPLPNTTNICSPVINQQYNLPNFCTVAGVGGDGNRRKYCSMLGDGEWVFSKSSDGCKYSWCNSVSRTTGGCNGGCCSIKGRGAYCQRVAFKADPTQCCFSDYKFSGKGCLINPDSNSSRTCDPNLRDITTDARPQDSTNNGIRGCRTLVGNACANIDSPTFDQDWGVGGRCIYAMNRILFGDYAGTVSVLNDRLIPDEYYTGGVGIQWARALLSEIISELESRGFVIPSRVGDPTYTPFQDTFIAMSRSAPGIVTGVLKNNICNGFTAENIIYDRTLTQLCGCHLADEQYERYTNVYGIPIECTPTCTIAGAVPVINEDNYTIRKCDQDVCVIDNINITLGNNNSDVNFSQVCGGCGPNASCRCFISGSTIDAKNGVIGDINFSQACGNNSVCTDNANRPIDCITGDLLDDEPLDGEDDEPPPKFRNTPYASVLWTSLFIILLLVILLIAVNNDNSGESETSANENNNIVYTTNSPN